MGRGGSLHVADLILDLLHVGAVDDVVVRREYARPLRLRIFDVQHVALEHMSDGHIAAFRRRRLARLRANSGAGPLNDILDFGAAHHEIDKMLLHLIGLGTALGRHHHARFVNHGSHSVDRVAASFLGFTGGRAIAAVTEDLGSEER